MAACGMDGWLEYRRHAPRGGTAAAAASLRGLTEHARGAALRPTLEYSQLALVLSAVCLYSYAAVASMMVWHDPIRPTGTGTKYAPHGGEISFFTDAPVVDLTICLSLSSE
jgi:hypothetical protein